MTDRYYAPPPGVRLSRDDHEWLTKLAMHEGTSVQTVVDHAVWFLRYWQATGKKAVRQSLEIIELLGCEYQKQAVRQRYFQREYQMQSRRLHNMRRAYEKQLWQERVMRRRYESQLRQERSMRRAYEEQLRRQRSCYEGQEEATTQSPRDAPYGPTVAKLLALAVCSESVGEAKAAFEKARSLHRLTALIPQPAPEPPGPPRPN